MMAGIQVVCSERHEAVQEKAHHHRVEGLHAFIENKPVIAPEGGCHACRDRRSEQGGRLCTSTPKSGTGHARMSACFFPVRIRTLCRGWVSCGPWECRAIYEHGRGICTSLLERWQEIAVRHRLLLPIRYQLCLHVEYVYLQTPPNIFLSVAGQTTRSTGVCKICVIFFCAAGASSRHLPATTCSLRTSNHASLGAQGASFAHARYMLVSMRSAQVEHGAEAMTSDAFSLPAQKRAVQPIGPGGDCKSENPDRPITSDIFH